MLSIFAAILKGRGRMRVVVLLQSCFFLALFSIRNSFDKSDGVAFKDALFLPAANDTRNMTVSRIRGWQDSQVSPVGTIANHHPSTNENPVNGQHEPHFFSYDAPFEFLLERNNILSVYTGCSIAAWTYGWHTNQPRIASFYDDCGHYSAEKQWNKDVTVDNVSEVQPGDSIYVELKKLDHFAQHLLPLIQVEFVLMSGQNHIAPMRPPLKPPYNRRTFKQIIHNPNVKYWFMMNLDKHSYDPFHPKHNSFPYGLSHVAHGAGKPADFNPDAKSIYLEELKRQNQTKNRSIFVGYINPDSNPDRANVPSGDKLPPHEYYRTMHESRYVLSPDGDRPECYRHYEAIGLGTMPITQLHPYLYGHLAGNVVFNETKWDVSDMEKRLPPNPSVNRRLLFEEYWMEYVERSVGYPVRWWDSVHQVRTSLDAITKFATTKMQSQRTKTTTG